MFQFTRFEIIEPRPTMENKIQAEMSMVGIMMAGILQDVYKSSSVVFGIVEKHSRILRGWQQNLPPPMRLDALLAPAAPGSATLEEPHRRSLILVHVLFLGSQVLLQRRLLVSIASCRMEKRWTLDGSPEHGQQIQMECVEAAATCVRLLDVLGYTRNMFRRCWLCM